MITPVIDEWKRIMSHNLDMPPEIDVLVKRLFREILKRDKMDAAMLASAMLVKLAEFLDELGVEVEVSNKR